MLWQNCILRGYFVIYIRPTKLRFDKKKNQGISDIMFQIIYNILYNQA